VNPPCTLDGECRHEDDIRKSRFLAQAAPVADVDAAMAFIERVSDPAASHNCWAYRIGQAYRFSDDGEPGGSAGKPILQAIEGQDLDRVAVVVTRWFGGIKLGVGGLIRAYGGTAAECLRRAQRQPIIDTVRVRFALGYAELPLLKARTQDWTLQLDTEDFGARAVDVTATVARAHVDALQRLLADLSRGSSTLQRLDQEGTDNP
jgi:uncharacterized YigZ family protein